MERAHHFQRRREKRKQATQPRDNGRSADELGAAERDDEGDAEGMGAGLEEQVGDEMGERTLMGEARRVKRAMAVGGKGMGAMVGGRWGAKGSMVGGSREATGATVRGSRGAMRAVPLGLLLRLQQASSQRGGGVPSGRL